MNSAAVSGPEPVGDGAAGVLPDFDGVDAIGHRVRGVDPLLMAIGGFSGSGKSTLAARLAPRIGRAPGALVLRSDVIRKALCGVDENERLGEEGYRPDVTRAVYASIAERAALALAGGQAVVADAVYGDPADRTAIADVAARGGVPFAGLWLDAPRATLAGRIERRRAGASDADAVVLDRQIAAGAGTIEWRRIDASGSPGDTERRARRLLETLEQAPPGSERALKR